MDWPIPFDELVAVLRSAGAPASGQATVRHSSMCYGCGEANPDGLRLDIYAGEGVGACTTLSADWRLAGDENFIRPGILAAAVHEVADHALQQTGLLASVVNVKVDFPEPVPVGALVRIGARVIGAFRNRVYVDVTANILDGDKPVGSALAIFECEA
ncbi:hypothetical protein [Nocardia sp. 348MFTsu5.1]|uniref:hypothetical protein n=1 Tax=Nocardia sp. 348MFTsu5.1 TaxID=1172185 RepID=UPI0012DC5B62|nr:hypothetical protein [Nocardia sp. 348MFTsu5.1]